MSNYLLLIMHEYFETLKKTKDIKTLGLKEIINEAWLAIILMGVAFVSLIVIMFFRTSIYLWYAIFFLGISVLLLIPITQYISQKAYERRKAVYDKKIQIFRKILSEFSFYDLKKIQKLIEQCDLSYTEYKFSKTIIDPVINSSKLVFLPIITFVSGLAVKNLSISITLTETITYLASIISGIIILVIFVYEIKWFLEEFLDRESRKMHTIKGILIDISIKDFIKEEDCEKSTDIYYL